MTFFVGDVVICINDIPLPGEAYAPKINEMMVVVSPIHNNDWVRVVSSNNILHNFRAEHFDLYKMPTIPPTQSGAEEYEEVMAAQEIMHGKT